MRARRHNISFKCTQILVIIRTNLRPTPGPTGKLISLKRCQCIACDTKLQVGYNKTTYSHNYRKLNNIYISSEQKQFCKTLNKYMYCPSIH